MTTLQQDDAAYAAKLERAQQMLDQWELEDAASGYAAGSCAPACEPLATPSAKVIDLRVASAYATGSSAPARQVANSQAEGAR